MKQNDRIPGAVIRRERLARGIEQKALCRGICVPSYLSKIERGGAIPNEELLAALYGRLGLPVLDAAARECAGALIDEGYRQVLYGLELSQTLEELAALGEGLAYADCSADWLILKGWRGEDTLEGLMAMEDCLDEERRNWLELLRWRFGRGSDMARLRSACLALGNSLALNAWVFACYRASDYAAVLRMEDRLTAQALEEGNTFQLAEYFILKGSAYSCLFLEDMMMLYYHRAINLLQNTGWQESLDDLYYNIGATQLNFGRFDEAERWLDRALSMAEDPLLLHKRALINIRRGDVERGREYLAAMRARLGEDGGGKESDWLRAEEAEWECRPGFLDSREYLALLERLLSALERDYHFGHVSFYQDVYLAACKRQRQYRKALEFQRRISERSVRIIG